jgi:hypothetical protein
MPSFVREVCIGRHGIHFYANFLKFSVGVSQVTQFSWANESEICRVEADNRPFSFQIGIADINKFAVVKSGSFEGLDRGVD